MLQHLRSLFFRQLLKHGTASEKLRRLGRVKLLQADEKTRQRSSSVRDLVANTRGRRPQGNGQLDSEAPLGAGFPLRHSVTELAVHERFQESLQARRYCPPLLHAQHGGGMI